MGARRRGCAPPGPPAAARNGGTLRLGCPCGMHGAAASTRDATAESATIVATHLVRRIVAVQPPLPKFVQPCAADDQRGVELEPIRPERGVVEKLADGLDVALPAHVGQVWHHVRDHLRWQHRVCASTRRDPPTPALPSAPQCAHLEPCVLGELEALAHCSHGVTAIGVACNVFVRALQPNLQAGAAIREHLGQVRHQAEVGARLDRLADALGARLLAVPTASTASRPEQQAPYTAVHLNCSAPYLTASATELDAWPESASCRLRTK